MAKGAARSSRSPSAPLTLQTPPHDLDAEIGTLGSMLIEPTVIPEVMEQVTPDAFYRPEHAEIFRVLVEMALERRTIDAVTVKAELESGGRLEKVGGAAYLGELMTRTATPANAAAYARIVRDKALLRQTVQVAHQVLKEAAEEPGKAEELIGRFEQMIFDVAERGQTRRAQKLSDFLEQTYQFIYHYKDQKKLGLSTGIFEIDDVLNGLQRGYLYVIAGRPSMGKTSLALRILEHVALEENKPAMMCSLEMPGEVLARVMLCAHCGVSLHKLHKGMIAAGEQKRLLESSHRFDRAPIFIDESSDLSIYELRARARRMKAEHGIELVIVDYLQLLTAPDSAESRQLEITMISKNLKAMARDLSVPVIALAQLNRSPEGREGNRPKLSDLRESGSIEQDADVVALLYREEYYAKETERKNICDIIIAKNRTGPTQSVEVAFFDEQMRFEPVSFLHARRAAPAAAAPF